MSEIQILLTPASVCCYGIDLLAPVPVTNQSRVSGEIWTNKSGGLWWPCGDQDTVWLSDNFIPSSVTLGTGLNNAWLGTLPQKDNRTGGLEVTRIKLPGGLRFITEMRWGDCWFWLSHLFTAPALSEILSQQQQQSASQSVSHKYRPPSVSLVIYPDDKGQRSRENYKTKLVFTIENLMKAKSTGDIVWTRREVDYWS